MSPKTHWEFHCVLANFKFKYINVSKTHWECQCVMETIMYLNYTFQRTHWNSQCVLETFKISNLEMSLITHWEILLISVWSVWSVLWRTSLNRNLEPGSIFWQLSKSNDDEDDMVCQILLYGPVMRSTYPKLIWPKFNARFFAKKTFFCCRLDI